MSYRFFCQAMLVASFCCSCAEKTNESASGSEKVTSQNAPSGSNAPNNAPTPEFKRGGSNSPSTNSTSEAATAEMHRLTLQVTGKDISSGKTVTDGEGNPVTAILPDGSRVFFQSSRPIALLAPTGMRTVYEYDPEGRLRTIIHPDGRRELVP